MAVFESLENFGLINPETGEVLGGHFTSDGIFHKDFDLFSHRILKFALQSTARAILPWEFTKDTGKVAKHKICICLRNRLPDVDQVAVYKNHESGSTFYGNLMICGSVWVCPICGSKITEKRAVRIQNMIDQHIEAGGECVMATFTFKHERTQTLKDQLSRFKGRSGALDGCMKSRKIRDMKTDIGFLGTINSLEMTFGLANGWHSHSHQLWFVSKGTDLARMKSRLHPQWANYCEKRGLGAPSFKNGIDIRLANTASSYISKMGWSASREIAKGHTKKGRKGNLAPFDLLQEYFENKTEWAKRAFVEYAAATHNSEYLNCSPKLRKLYDWDLATDEELAHEHTEESMLMGTLNIEEWRKVLKAKNGRGMFLEIAKGKWEDAITYVEALSDS